MPRLVFCQTFRRPVAEVFAFFRCPASRLRLVPPEVQLQLVEGPAQVELGSRSGLAMNPDGSTDIYVAPQPPKGAPESNWIPTLPGRAWFTYFRLYAPLQPYFDASWKLPDIEAV